MRLVEILDAGARTTGADAADIVVTGITADSREVEPGFLFAALPGVATDGRHFIADALANGAAALLVAPDAVSKDLGRDVCVLIDDNPRRRLALLSAAFHRPQPEIVVAVTGTNGKTAVASFARQIWTALGRDAASIGTLGVDHASARRSGALTTPDPVTLHLELARLAREGLERTALEASSHGLAQFRLDGVRIAAAGFTNLSRDHLDYHVSFEDYRAAKRRLFDELLPPGATAVLNADSPEFGVLAQSCIERGRPVIDYGLAASELRVLDCVPDGDEQVVELVAFGQARQARLAFAGGFQAANALCAVGLVAGAGDDWQAAIEALETLQAPPGRLQLAARGRCGAPIYVDYAHTPDALARALAALKPHAAARLAVVFGCGGDRDPGKRPLMGEAAARFADRVIVTDDNPRTEDPAAIRRAIMAACPAAREIGDRAEAIRAAIADLRKGDVLVVSGKGHETGQIVGDTVRPFDDVETVRAAAREFGGIAA